MTELFGALATGSPDDAVTTRVRMAAIGHAMSFETWRSLTGNGLSDAETADMMVRLVTAVAAKPNPAGG